MTEVKFDVNNLNAITIDTKRNGDGTDRNYPSLWQYFVDHEDDINVIIGDPTFFGSMWNKFRVNNIIQFYQKFSTEEVADNMRLRSFYVKAKSYNNVVLQEVEDVGIVGNLVIPEFNVTTTKTLRYTADDHDKGECNFTIDQDIHLFKLKLANNAEIQPTITSINIEGISDVDGDNIVFESFDSGTGLVKFSGLEDPENTLDTLTRKGTALLTINYTYTDLLGLTFSKQFFQILTFQFAKEENKYYFYASTDDNYTPELEYEFTLGGSNMTIVGHHATQFATIDDLQVGELVYIKKLSHATQPQKGAGGYIYDIDKVAGTFEWRCLWDNGTMIGYLSGIKLMNPASVQVFADLANYDLPADIADFSYQATILYQDDGTTPRNEIWILPKGSASTATSNWQQFTANTNTQLTITAGNGISNNVSGLNNTISAVADSNKGIIVSSSGIGIKNNSSGGLIVDSYGEAIKLNKSNNNGLSVDSNGLFVPKLNLTPEPSNSTMLVDTTSYITFNQSSSDNYRIHFFSSSEVQYFTPTDGDYLAILHGAYGIDIENSTGGFAVIFGNVEFENTTDINYSDCIIINFINKYSGSSNYSYQSKSPFRGNLVLKKGHTYALGIQNWSYGSAAETKTRLSRGGTRLEYPLLQPVKLKEY